MRKNYNYKRRKLYLPEYGRHIQEMVDSLLLIDDRQERTRQAKAVIAVMGNINPMLRDTEDFKHKLWDHLFIMSDFKLDVDSPYAQPSRQDLMITPQKLNYTQSRIAFKHYGKYTQQLIQEIAKEGDESRRSGNIANVARYMRAKSYEFNNEHPNNEAIARDICIMSNGELEVDPAQISHTHSDYHRNSQSQRRPMRKSQPQRINNRKQAKNNVKGQSRHNNHK